MADPQKKVQFSEESIYKQKIAAFILEHYAIKATDISLHTLDYFIGKRFKELNKTFPEYYEYLIQNYHENGHEIKLLLDEITIQETYFFRDMGQFQALTEYVIPRLIELKRGKDQSLRIWSAGCSTGEEPYTIAMVLREYFPHILDWDILIRATDVNVFALQKARQGVYRKHSFRGVSDFIISKYFEQEKNMYSLKDTVKEMVSFDFFNLASDTFLPVGRGNKWDIIFCRNVLIYFHKERIKSLLKRFHSALSDSGYLFLGFSENIFSYSDDFESIHYENSFFYKKKSAAKIGEKKRSLSRRPKAEVKREKFKKCPFPNGAIRNPKAAEAIYEEKLKDILALFSLEKYEQAWNKIQHIKIVPSENLTEHLFIKVRILSNLSKFDEANYMIETILSRDPLHKEAYFLKALILIKESEIDGAIENFKKVLYVDPDYALARLYLGDLYRLTGKFKPSFREYQNALLSIKRNPDKELGPFAVGFSPEILTQTFINKLKSLENSNQVEGRKQNQIVYGR